MTTPNIPILVAHRGYTTRYPENTLPGIEAALRAGACMVEIDIQLTADRVAVLYHDRQMQRTSGIDADITTLTYQQLTKFNAGENNRFDHHFATTPIPTLTEFLQLLAAWPEAKALVEIKEESLETFGQTTVMDIVLAAMAPYRKQCIPISYAEQALAYARQQGWPIGWVLHRFDSHHQHIAQQLSADYLICNYRKLDAPLWPGPWQWMLYEVVDAELALELAAKGAAMIETMAIGDMFEHPLLGQQRCHPAPHA